MRIAIGIEYNGTGFAGWQRQPHGNTIQNALEQALTQIAGHPLTVQAAGRTDAGVHAAQQVAHFDTQAKRPLTAWVRGVNSYLPSSIAILWARAVDDRFHARFSACARSYSYYLLNHPVRPALLSGRVGWHFQPLDVTLMRQAAHRLLGKHDFSSFRAAECQAKSPVKNLSHLDITQQGDLLRFDFRADAFLHHMVRNIVGALVYVGKGTLSLADFSTLIDARSRILAPPTFMPDGLYLTEVEYPAEYGLLEDIAPIRLIGSR